MHDGTFDPKAWLLDTRNIALRIEDDLGMFEHCGPGIYLGHVWFQSRGREAVTRAKAILAEMFASYGATRINGETPVTCPHAWAFARLLGFKRIGFAMRPMGVVILSTLNGNLKPPASVP